MPANVKTESTIEVPTLVEFLNLESRVSDLESSGGSGGGGLSLQHYNSGNSSERVTSIDNDVWNSVYSVPLGAVTAGEILIVLAEVEGTNDEGVNIRFSTSLILTDDPDKVSGTEVGESTAFNITPNMHHGVATKVGTLVVPADMPDAYVNLRASSNKRIKIEQDYGRLSVIRITP